VTAKGRIAAATYRKRLRMTTARQIFIYYTLQQDREMPLSGETAPLPRGNLWADLSSCHKRHLDRLSGFVGRAVDKHTDTETSVCACTHTYCGTSFIINNNTHRQTDTHTDRCKSHRVTQRRRFKPYSQPRPNATKLFCRIG